MIASRSPKLSTFYQYFDELHAYYGIRAASLVLATSRRYGTIAASSRGGIRGCQYEMLNDGHLKLYQELGIPADYGRARDLPVYAEASELVDVGPNLVGRMQRLTPACAASWQQMVETAASDGIRLLIVSGFRSVDYQAELIRNKLAAGQQIAEILTVNAAPGFSEHHSGAAVDIATPGSRPLTEEFEQSDAFAWLTDRAVDHGFSMTYPRGNRFGFIYEPWHWAIGDEAG